VFARRLLFLFFLVRGIVFLLGWHHIVAAWTGRALDGPLRAGDVWVTITGRWFGDQRNR
jgi:hypothetical protein